MKETANDRLQKMVQQYQAGGLSVEAYRKKRALLLDYLECEQATLDGDTTLPHGIPAVELDGGRHPRRGVLIFLALALLIGVGVMLWSLGLLVEPTRQDQQIAPPRAERNGVAMVQEFLGRDAWGVKETQDFLTAWYGLPGTERRGAIEGGALRPMDDAIRAHVAALRAQGAQEEEIQHLREFASDLGLGEQGVSGTAE